MMVTETAEENKARLDKGLTIEEAYGAIDVEVVVPVIENKDAEEIALIKEELDEKEISYSPLAGLKSLRKKLKDS